MSCSVNLVPDVRLHAQARARRRIRWFGAGTLFGFLLVAGWGIQRIASGAVARFATEVSTLQIQRTEVQRRQLAATAQRTRLIEQLKTVAAARHSQPWPRRLVTLTRVVPDGVFLTNVDVSTPDAAPSPAPATPPTKPAAAAAAAVKTPLQAVHLRGYAVNHDALVELLNALHKLPDWPHVELVRAGLEPQRGGSAVAFELDCRTAEALP